MMLTDYSKAIAAKLGKNTCDLGIREVLQHLTHDAQVAEREIVHDDVEALKGNIFSTEDRLISLNERVNHVHSKISDLRPGNATADTEVAAAEIHDRADSMCCNNRIHEVGEVFGKFVIGARARIEFTYHSAPHVALINFGENFCRRLGAL